MTLFGCDHRWVEVGRTYTASALTKLGQGTEEMFDRMAFGITNIEQRCEVCGKTTVDAFVGRVGDVGDGGAA